MVERFRSVLFYLLGRGDPEVVLMMSRSVTSIEADLLSDVFDKVLVPAPVDRGIGSGADIVPIKNILYYHLPDLPIEPTKRDLVCWEAEGKILPGNSVFVAVPRSDSLSGKFRAHDIEAKFSYARIEILGHERAFGGPESLPRITRESFTERPADGRGLFCKDLKVGIAFWKRRIDFIILRDDETVRDAIASAARAHIRTRLFSGRSGLESY